MKVLLINPPVGSVYLPPLGILCLKSFLEKNGIEVIQRDISIDYVHYLLNPVNLEKIYKNNLSLLDGKISQKMLSFIRSLRVGKETDYIKSVSEINFTETLKYLFENWTEEGIKIRNDINFKKQVSMLTDGLILSTLKYFPNIISTVMSECNKGILDSKELNPFYGFYKEKIIPEIKKCKPDIIGFSFSYIQQIIPGVSLLNEIRNSGIQAPVLSGGACFSTMCGYLIELNGRVINLNNKNNSLTDIIESLKLLVDKNCFGIYGEGENPLLEVCNKIEQKQSFIDVSGLVYNENKNTIRFNETARQVDFKNYQILNFDNLPIGKKYFVSSPVAAIQSSRGCYWRKCTFCNHMETLGANYRQMSAENLFQSIKIYYEKYGIKRFFFTDECMTTAMLKSFSEKVLTSGLKLKFGIIVRIEKAFENIIPLASKAGLTFLSFGLESACERILNRMDKGFKIQDASKIIDICHESKVAVHFNVMFGFPTETEEEAEETFNFISRNSEKIFCFGANTWVLSPGSLIMKNPDAYGIEFFDGAKNPFDPSTFRIAQGINNQRAYEYISRMISHEKLRKIIELHRSQKELHMMNALLSDNSDY